MVAPKNIRPNADYHVSVSVHENPTPCELLISITDEAGYKNTQEVTVEPFATQLLQFRTGAMSPGQYKITAEGLKGIVFKNETLINYHGKNTTVLVQSDKAIYKPGDLVRFRILILDSNMRPRPLLDRLKFILP